MWRPDVVAEECFPFISSERFTLREFATQPRRWFAFTQGWCDFPGAPTLTTTTAAAEADAEVEPNHRE